MIENLAFLLLLLTIQQTLVVWILFLDQRLDLHYSHLQIQSQ
jgi:hypothetical protein